MNVPSSVAFDSHPIVPAASLATHPFYWSVQRELWEYRSIYVAPLAVAGLYLFGFVISMFRLPGRMRAASAIGPMQLHAFIEKPYTYAALLIMATEFIVAIFYCLDALHGERRDRSILFWKSLPVSDLTTVLSKASIPIVVLPLVSVAVTVGTQWIMLLINSAALLASGVGIGALWTNLPLLPMWTMLFWHLLAGHGLWYAPIYGWLLLVSSWARRAGFLWAALPLLVIGVVEKIAFNTSHFASMLGHRISGGSQGADFVTTIGAMHPAMHLPLGEFLLSPGLWVGLAITAAFLAAAVRLRRKQGPI